MILIENSFSVQFQSSQNQCQHFSSDSWSSSKLFPRRFFCSTIFPPLFPHHIFYFPHLNVSFSLFSSSLASSQSTLRVPPKSCNYEIHSAPLFLDFFLPSRAVQCNNSYCQKTLNCSERFRSRNLFVGFPCPCGSIGDEF